MNSQNHPPTPGFELEDIDHYREFLLDTRVDILFVLRAMVKRGAMATLYFDQGRHFFPSWLLAINDDETGLIWDPCGDTNLAASALAASPLIVNTHIDRVKVQFRIPAMTPGVWRNKPAWISALPETLLRIQRREYFRLDISDHHPLICRIPHPVISEEADDPALLRLKLLDIGGGGISLACPESLSDYFRTGAFYQNCRIDLHDEGSIPTTLRVRSALDSTDRSGKAFVRVGCEFVSLPAERLNTIQHYITRVERERAAKTLSG